MFYIVQNVKEIYVLTLPEVIFKSTKNYTPKDVVYVLF